MTAAKTIDDYISDKPGPVATLLSDLRRLVMASLPDAREGMKWGAPVFFNAGQVPVIYLYGGRDHANLGFVQGATLRDPDHLLHGTGASGRHVKLFPGRPMPEAALAALIGQCATLAAGAPSG
ncbi:MAG: DUF1801 domain-containing protein [Alphaproteobacteria bacterium]|nr:DUF1801 domain-containing protein [Alphaproteobacteria bacterium]